MLTGGRKRRRNRLNFGVSHKAAMLSADGQPMPQFTSRQNFKIRVLITLRHNINTAKIKLN